MHWCGLCPSLPPVLEERCVMKHYCLKKNQKQTGSYQCQLVLDKNVQSIGACILRRGINSQPTLRPCCNKEHCVEKVKIVL